MAIHLADQELHPQMDVEVVLEKQPNPKNITDTTRKYLPGWRTARKKVLHEEAVELEPLRPVDFQVSCRKGRGLHHHRHRHLKVPLSTRPVEIRDINVEFQNTARNMETLRQWASVSDGLAFKAEECPDASELVARIQDEGRTGAARQAGRAGFSA